ncbi:MAG: hypothetical protein ACJ72B_00030, partial [Ornithinibacter sp.]
MSRLPLRVRLVAGFVVAMLVLLTAAGAFVYWRVEYALDRGLDTELDQATAVITPLVGPTAAPSAVVARRRSPSRPRSRANSTRQYTNAPAAVSRTSIATTNPATSRTRSGRRLIARARGRPGSPRRGRW